VLVNPHLILHRAEQFQATVLPDGRWLLYNAADNKAITLSAPAGIFWELCDGRVTFAQVLEALKTYYPQTEETVLKAESEKLLDELVLQGLVMIHAE
jgi:hypothetical protein